MTLLYIVHHLVMEATIYSEKNGYRKTIPRHLVPHLQRDTVFTQQRLKTVPQNMIIKAKKVPVLEKGSICSNNAVGALQVF